MRYISIKNLPTQDQIAGLRITAFIFFFFVFLTVTTVNASTPSNSSASSTSTLINLRSRTPTLTTTRAKSSPTALLQSASISSRMPGQPQPDANTVALYHFDTSNSTVADDATGTYPGTMFGNAQIGTGQYAGGLQLDGNASYVRTGYLGDFSSGTVEAFIDFRSACYATSSQFTILSAGSEFGNGSPVMKLYVDLMLNFSILTPSGWQTVSTSINPCRYLVEGLAPGNTYWAQMTPPPSHFWPYEAWRFHHVAATWGPRGIELWVDGVLHGTGWSPDNNLYCNPQSQLGATRYPDCDSPVFGYIPPYTYTGGLTSYSTFLIGCDSTGVCSRGIIDEVRISRNIQRTFDWRTTIPTSTPTPTTTPVNTTGGYVVDPDTLVLYHMNSQTQWSVPDAVGWRDGIFGPGGPSPAINPNGYLGNGLELKGTGSYIVNYNMGDWANGTIEAWVHVNDISTGLAIASAGRNYNLNWDGMFLGADSQYGATLRFGLNDGTHWYWADSGLPASYFLNSWHHVAGTWGSRGMEIWVDGLRYGTNLYQGQRLYDQNDDYHLFGCNSWSHCMKGMLDEVRVSKIQRVFAPVAPLTPTNTPSPTPTWAPFTPSFWNQLPFVAR